MKYPKLRELREAVKSLVSKPYTVALPAEGHRAERFRGKPEYHEEHCVGCGACAEVCPSNAIKIIDPEEPVTVPDPIRKLELRYDTCIFCGNCEANCITDTGIQLSGQYDLALFDRRLATETVEKNLVVCEVCHSIITTRDHLLWLARQIGTLAYGNPNLLLISQPLNAPVRPEEKKGLTEEEMRRVDIMKLLCPKCRHQVMLKDIWG